MSVKRIIILAILCISFIFVASSMAQMYELVLDNTDPEHEQYGTWKEYKLAGAHGNNTVHAKPKGTGLAYFRYLTPSGGEMAYGQYNIYARWITNKVLATDTKYRIYPGVGSVDVRVNQEVNHARWILLGTFDINHPRPVVRVYDDANGYVEADGIRFVRVGDLSFQPSETDKAKGYYADEIE